MTVPIVGDITLTVPAVNVDGKQIPLAVPTGIPKVGDTVTVIPIAGDQVKYAAAVTTVPAVGDTVAVVPLEGGGSIKWAAVNGGTVRPAPTYRGQWGLGYRPFGITTDGYGDVYVTDPDHALVWKYDSTGKFLLKWGGAGSGTGQFNQPLGIAADPAGDIYVADQGNGRIQKFTSTGTFILTWGSGQFSSLMDVAADTEGYIYATDYGADCIRMFTSTGGGVRSWAQDPREMNWYWATNMFRPNGIGVGSDGNIYSTDSDGVHTALTDFSHVKVHTPAGEFVQMFGGESWHPQGITGDARGHLYVIDAAGDPGSGSVLMYSLAGILLASWGGFYQPHGVAVDLAGNVYVTDTFNHRIMGYVSGGTGWARFLTKDMTYPITIRVYRVGNVDPADIADALASIPSDLWTFVYSITAAPGTDWVVEPTYGVPWPVRDCALAIAPASEFPGATSIGAGCPFRAGVLMLTEPVADLTQRIWHELLHGITGIENPDHLQDSTGFPTWMTANHPGVTLPAYSADHGYPTPILLYWDEYLIEQVRAL